MVHHFLFMLLLQGCHGQGKIREKQIFLKVMEKSGNCVPSQGISKFYLKVSEKSGNFTFVIWFWKEIPW